MTDLIVAAHPAVEFHKQKADTKRIGWIDSARGICIFLVVVGHVIGGIKGARLADDASALGAVYYYIYTFHMAAFFVLSGLIAKQSVSKNKQKFLTNLFKHILYPYFLYSILTILIMNIFSNYLNTPLQFNLTEFSTIITGHVSLFWFLKTLFFIHLLYLILTKYLSAQGFLLLSIALHGFPDLVPLPEDLSEFSTFAIYYALGIVFSDNALNWPSRCRFPLLWAGICGALWLWFATLARAQGVPSQGGHLNNLMFPAAVTGILSVFALSGVQFIQNNPLLQYFGKHSLAIFCLHILFVSGARIMLMKLLAISAIPLIFPLTLLAGIAGPLLIVKAAERCHIRSVIGL